MKKEEKKLTYIVKLVGFIYWHVVGDIDMCSAENFGYSKRKTQQSAAVTIR